MQDYTKKKAIKKRRSRKGLSSSDDLIHKLIKSLNLKSQFEEYYIQRHYETLFGKNITKNSYPARLINKTLYLTVINSAWSMQLSFIKDEIVRKINENAGKKVVKNVIFKVGRLPKRRGTSKAGNHVDLRKIVLSDEIKKSIAKDVKDIKDLELREAIIAAKTAYFKRKLKE